LELRWSEDGPWEERLGRKKAEMTWRDLRMALEKVKKRELHHPPPINILVLFFSF